MHHRVGAIAILLTVLIFSVTSSEVPKMINYQGKLTDPQGVLIDSTISITFSIYSDSVGGDILWSETQSSVLVQNGIFSVLLGSVNPIPDSVFTGSIRYLGVKVGDDDEMIPRRAIVSVGYSYLSGKSIQSENADMVDSKHASELEGIKQSQVYETEWIPLEAYPYCYERTHNLGTDKLLIVAYYTYPDTNAHPTIFPLAGRITAGTERTTGVIVGDITNTKLCFCYDKTSADFVEDIQYGSCKIENRSGGWFKLVAIALP